MTIEGYFDGTAVRPLEPVDLKPQQKVFINSKTIYKDSVLLKENDSVTIRGYGKYIFTCIYNETKKHKQLIGVRVYR